MYLGLRLNLGKSSKVIVFRSIVNTFELSNNTFSVSLNKFGSSLKPNRYAELSLYKSVGKEEIKKVNFHLSWLDEVTWHIVMILAQPNFG